MTTIDRLQQVRQLLDEQRRHLDKAPLTGDLETVLATAQAVEAVRAMLDEIGEALAPHARSLSRRRQSQITGGWVIYDRDDPTSWPPPNRPLVVRQYHDHGEAPPQYRDQRRGMYEGGRLTWREKGVRPLQGQPDGLPVPPGYLYSWREA